MRESPDMVMPHHHQLTQLIRRQQNRAASIDSDASNVDAPDDARAAPISTVPHSLQPPPGTSSTAQSLYIESGAERARPKEADDNSEEGTGNGPPLVRHNHSSGSSNSGDDIALRNGSIFIGETAESIFNSASFGNMLMMNAPPLARLERLSDAGPDDDGAVNTNGSASLSALKHVASQRGSTIDDDGDAPELVFSNLHLSSTSSCEKDIAAMHPHQNVGEDDDALFHGDDSTNSSNPISGSNGNSNNGAKLQKAITKSRLPVFQTITSDQE